MAKAKEKAYGEIKVRMIKDADGNTLTSERRAERVDGILDEAGE